MAVATVGGDEAKKIGNEAKKIDSQHR
ncbi:uncharacterized protein G2W53_018852 [Senna tora]|uniref:Uncharacterized protein n=1 Tax=Senna tora TaxID=362788 RepID=A0A834WNQ2_9FABA|nr:uncharacterized protein G2W53_018852 [Senna tora]